MVLEEKGLYDIIYNGRNLTVFSENGKIIVGNQTYYPKTSTRYTSKDMKMNSYLVQVNDFSFRIEYIDGRTYLNGREVDFSFRISIKKIEKKLGTSTLKQSAIYAMIPGIITDIPVEIGDKVIKNQSIIYLEAMKMRNDISAPISGIIETINVKVNQQVSKDDLLLVITPINDDNHSN